MSGVSLAFIMINMFPQYIIFCIMGFKFICTDKWLNDQRSEARLKFRGWNQVTVSNSHGNTFMLNKKTPAQSFCHIFSF